MNFSSLIILLGFLVVIFLILLSFKYKKNSNSGKNRFYLEFWFAPIIGILFLIFTLSINQEVIIRGVIGSENIQPFAILILFMSLAYICISLDLTGFFEYLALYVLKAAKNSGKRLFIYFFFFSSILTLFTSNDIVILTITPIIIYFAKYTKINPIPYLIAQFFAANIWSFALYIGNPTNIIVAEAYDFTFLSYSSWTILPTITAGIVCFGLLWIVFRKQIPITFESPIINPKTAIKDKNGAIFGVVILILCLFMLSIAPFFNLSLWQITLFFALIILFRNIIYHIYTNYNGSNLRTIQKSFKRMPWKIVPFIIGMFIMVEALVASGWVDIFAYSLSNLSDNLLISIFIIAFLTSLACNLMNNQPMTILFTQIFLSSSYQSSDSVKLGIIFALIMGSNFGANFTLIGSLAGIMWYKILSDKEVKITFKQFARYGFLIMPIVISISCLVLYLELLFWYG
jgi:arsenical pump membrane protein